VGFGAAAEDAALVVAEEVGRVAGLREQLENGIRSIASNAVIISETVLRVPNTTCFAVPGMAAETTVIAFDLEGIAVSAGAACSSGKVGVSPTLIAMKVESEIARCAIRVSLGWNTTEADVVRFLEVFTRLHASMTERNRTKAA
jgi:cysteine desulfurase